jgi:hypothetical protein
MGYLYRYLDTVGDGSGTKNANGDYSATTATLLLTPSAGEYFHVNRMIVSIEDSSGGSAAEYGNATALDSGILVLVNDANGTVADLTDSEKITTNASWGKLCYDVDQKTWGTGNELFLVRWTFGKSGQMVTLDGDQGEYMEVKIHGNCSGLVSHYFMVQGMTT